MSAGLDPLRIAEADVADIQAVIAHQAVRLGLLPTGDQVRQYLAALDRRTLALSDALTTTLGRIQER